MELTNELLDGDVGRALKAAIREAVEEVPDDAEIVAVRVTFGFLEPEPKHDGDLGAVGQTISKPGTNPTRVSLLFMRQAEFAHALAVKAYGSAPRELGVRHGGPQAPWNGDGGLVRRPRRPPRRTPT